jgi:hypothetical protein
MTTKKEAKAAQVLENKRIAFFKKVQSLTGHVFDRTKRSTIQKAFEAGQTADECAVEIVNQEPVGAAVHAVKVQAVDYAEKMARQTVERVTKELAEHGGDMNAYAPYPYGSGYGYQTDVAKAKHNLVSSLTESDPSKGYQVRSTRNTPYFVVICEKDVERFVQRAREEAALQYDAFICKMVAKVGECVSAKLEGSHVWGHSFLTVEKEDGVEVWKTQQIVNQTKYGNPYYQWPSRKMN